MNDAVYLPQRTQCKKLTPNEQNNIHSDSENVKDIFLKFQVFFEVFKFSNFWNFRKKSKKN